MGSISCGGVGVWSVTHRQRVRSRDDTQVGSRAEERPESQENLYKKKKGIYLYGKQPETRGDGEDGRAVSQGAGPAHADPRRFWKAQEDHTKACSLNLAGMGRNTKAETWSDLHF